MILIIVKGAFYMKHNSSHKSAASNTQSMANYARSKDAYDGNMEITNLKSSSQKISGMVNNSVEPLSESTRLGKDGPGGE